MPSNSSYGRFGRLSASHDRAHHSWNRSQWTWLGIFLLAILYALNYETINEPIQSIVWHVAHGNHVTVQGHTFRLPILWRAVKASRGETFRHSLDTQINISHSPGGILTERRALEMQSRIARNGTRSSLRIRFLPENIHAAKLTFYCVRQETDAPNGIYLCYAPGTDWQIGAAGKKSDIDTIRYTLASVQ